jgi:nicotinamide-nucleotide amidase
MRPIASAGIVAVGTELLTPHRIDTNSLYLTAQLNEIGIDVRSKCVVGDGVADLESAIRHLLDQVDVVLLTGGLGPTADDLTREAAAAVLGRTMHEDAALVDQLRQRFAARGFAMPEINRRQAQVPEHAIVLPNAHGSAPGLWLDHDERVVVLLPGPPRELQPMFEASVRGRLAARAGARVLRRRVIKIAGQPESRVDEVAAPIYEPLLRQTPSIETTILASPGQVELHVSARGTKTDELDAALEQAVQALARALGASVFSTDGRAIERVVGERLRERGLRIALAESCTGGMIAARLTDTPGSSAYLTGGVVAYSNEVKHRQLGVAPETLNALGAVSEAVASAMAEGVRERLRADIGLAVTGIAGPDGGTPEKPVGTVCFAVAGPGTYRETVTRRVPGDRDVIRQWSVMVALDLVRRALR